MCEVASDWIKSCIQRSVVSRIDFSHDVHSVLETAIEGPGSNFCELFQDVLSNKCRSWLNIRNCYQRFLVFGLIHHAADITSGYSVRVCQRADDGSLCFILDGEGTKAAVFCLSDASSEKSLHDSYESLSRKSFGPLSLGDRFPVEVNECRVYRISFWGDRAAMCYSNWRRKLNGAWKFSGKSL